MEVSEHHFDVMESIGKHIDQLLIGRDQHHFDVVESIRKHIDQIKPWFPSQAIICIGEYPIQILLKGSFIEKTDDALPIFVGKSSKDIRKWSQSRLEPYNILGLDTKLDTYFWFHVYPNIIKNDAFIARLKNKPINSVHQAIIVSSIWEGVGSALLPSLSSQLKLLNINSVSLAVLPSKLQPPDVHFNAFSSIGISVSTDSTPVLLMNRENLENYVGTNRKGTKMTGTMFLNYLLELLLAKETLVQELSELSRSFSVKLFTVLSATGASLRIYGSVENVLAAALLRPLLTFDLSSASVLYVLLRIPSHLKTKLPREKIELSIVNWFKDKASLKSIYFSDPIYVEDTSDRIDVVMFVGGFDVTEMFTSMEKDIDAIKGDAIDRGFINAEEWQVIVKSLVED
ncbi:MAG: hypothetical protein PVH73_07530 [Candidatus Bathyarchaeota archaeon]|jgi:hypothetical protein